VLIAYRPPHLDITVALVGQRIRLANSIGRPGLETALYAACIGEWDSGVAGLTAK